MDNDIDPKWAWAPYDGKDWDLKKVGHLYRRAGIGATWTALHEGLKAGPEKTIDRLLKPGQADDFDSVDDKKLTAAVAQANNGQLLSAWWLSRLLYSPMTLREKMTLFWHNHFATSNAKVQNAGYMIGQYRLLRREALGNFAKLLQDISHDPAMMVWLDTAQSKKGMPNENYSRELMELFALGIGNFTEKDVREAARAFTGWELSAGAAKFNPGEHDDGEKTVLGKTGKFKGADIVGLCLEQKSCPSFIASKLFTFLVSETIPATPELLTPLAEQLKKSGYDFGALVETVLRSNLFFSDKAYRTKIKSPVEFALGIAKPVLDLPLPEEERRIGTTGLATALDGLGQNLFNPPSVKGWDGGTTWLNGQTLLFRQNLALALSSTEDQRFVQRRKDGQLVLDPARLARSHDRLRDKEVVEFFLDLFLQGDVPADTRTQLAEYAKRTEKQSYPVYWTAEEAADHRIRSLCHLVLTQPEFQLN